MDHRSSTPSQQAAVPPARPRVGDRPHRRGHRPATHLVLPVVALTAVLAPLPAAARVVPQMAHVLVVVMENHSYNEVRGLPYIAGLITRSSSFSQSFAVTHPSQPNYVALWAANLLGVTNDDCPAPGTPFTAENLGHACETAGLTWKAYCENLPAVGSPDCESSDGLYRRKHAPWPDFSNLNHSNEVPYSQIAGDIARGALPALAYVIPNMCDDMHDCSTALGDAWLASNLPAMISAVGPQGLVIVTWDEDDKKSHNNILTVFAGPMLRAGYVSSRKISHYTVVRTVCEALGLTPFGLAALEPSIDDVWVTSTPIARSSWGHLKTIYRQ